MAIPLENLIEWLSSSLSPDPALRHAAESSLSLSSTTPGFPTALIHLIISNSAPAPIRLAAAVHFKNHIRSHWTTFSPNPIPDFEKQLIKSLILSSILVASVETQPLLLESLSLISSIEYPHHWPTLLSELVNLLRSRQADSCSVNALLSSVHSLFRKFRQADDNINNSLRTQLQYCLDNFAEPLQYTFFNTSHRVDGTPAAEDLESLRLCCEIFRSLNSVELSEFFKDNMKLWMEQFLAYLSTSYSEAQGGRNALNSLRTAICNIIVLFVEKYEEEFKVYLDDFVSAVPTLLMSLSSCCEDHELTLAALKFLTAVSKSFHYALLGATVVYSPIFYRIVLPNIKISQEDEELFNMNYIEYVRMDIKGSNVDTKRWIACELLKGIASHYNNQVVALVKRHIQDTLTAYRTNPAENWKEKVSCIYLVFALAPKGGDTCRGFHIDVCSFYTDFIAPELGAHDVNTFPILKAAALNFLTVFRDQIPKTEVLRCLVDLPRFLLSESNAVCSYAANCIEKLLAHKHKIPYIDFIDVVFSPKYTAAETDPFVPLLMQTLFTVLKQSESQENPYIMKGLTGVLRVGNFTGDTAKFCIYELSQFLTEVCKNPKNPTFNRHLLRAICAFIGDGHSRNVPALVRMLKAYLQKVVVDLNDIGILMKVVMLCVGLISAPGTEELGFYLLNTVAVKTGYDALARCSVNIWSIIFSALNNRRTNRLVTSSVIFLSLVLINHGTDSLVRSLESVWKNLFLQIVCQLWIPYLDLITGPVEMKLASVAATRLICKSPVLLDPSNSDLWGKMLNSLVRLLVPPAKKKRALPQRIDKIQVLEIEVLETMGFSADFACLHYTCQKDEDPLKEINDPKQFLVASLATLSAQTPGRYPSLIQKYVAPSNQAALLQLCSIYNYAVV